MFQFQTGEMLIKIQIKCTGSKRCNPLIQADKIKVSNNEKVFPKLWYYLLKSFSLKA